MDAAVKAALLGAGTWADWQHSWPHHAKLCDAPWQYVKSHRAIAITQVDAAVKAAKLAPEPPLEWMWRNMW